MVKFNSLVCALSAVFLLFAGSETARAHDPEAESMFFRDRNASVKGRTRPEFQSEGIQNGAWIWDPELKVGVISHDNIFASAVNTQSDLIWTINPTLDVETTWSRHGIQAYASGLSHQYSDFSDESYWDSEFGASVHFDVARATKVEAGGAYASLTESRTRAGAANFAVSPVEFDTQAWFVGVETELSRTRFQARFDQAEYDFEDAALVGGGVLDQDFRDRKETFYTVRADYALSPDTAIFARYRHNERTYDLKPPNVARVRDSSGYIIDVGADFDIGGVARGQIGVGYNEQEYDDPTFGSIDGLGVDGLIEWFPTQLTTVTFAGSRHIEDSPIVGSGGFTSSAVSATVDHELRRNLVISASVSAGEDDFLGIDRVDERWGASASATWYVNRNVGAEAWIAYTDQDSIGTAGGQDFESTAVGVRLVLRP
jgi:hypothetical protein